MRVLVPDVPGTHRSAHLALRNEGVEHECVLMVRPESYAAALALRWRDGEEFAVVEHDVVPWPGALAALAGCEALWCAHEYPVGLGTVAAALGCTRFSARLLRLAPELLDAHAGVPWREVDRLLSDVRAVAGPPHVHRPPVAHVRALAYFGPDEAEGVIGSPADFKVEAERVTRFRDDACRRAR